MEQGKCLEDCMYLVYRLHEIVLQDGKRCESHFRLRGWQYVHLWIVVPSMVRLCRQFSLESTFQASLKPGFE